MGSIESPAFLNGMPLRCWWAIGMCRKREKIKPKQSSAAWVQNSTVRGAKCQPSPVGSIGLQLENLCFIVIN